MRIAIATSGRFHMLDLARELCTLGHDVRFYSYVPLKRAMQFGLPRAAHRNLLPYVAPLVAYAKFAPDALKDGADALLIDALDRAISFLIEPCDVFIGISALSMRSALHARRRYGAKVIIERGSRHALSQIEILEAIPGTRRPIMSAFNLKRELAGYEFADLITVPSRHVEASFTERGVPPEKLFRNPYGVDLNMFQPTTKPMTGVPTAVFTGNWSLRKGCDLLWDVCRTDDRWDLLHVGSLGDAAVPQSPRFTHFNPVPQPQLAEIYGRADIFVHPSREEGLSLIQAQALACGLPLVCTDRTGGADLRDMIADPDWVTVVPHDDPTALGQGIQQAFTKASGQTGLRDILGVSREKLSWRAYGARYDRMLRDWL